MIERFIAWVQRTRVHRDVYREEMYSDVLYLRRYYLLRTKYLGIFVHEFLGDDAEGLHDHPWDFFLFVLRGGYWERTPAGREWRGAELPVRLGPGLYDELRLREALDREAPKRKLELGLHPLKRWAFRKAEELHRVEVCRDFDGEPQRTWSIVFRFKRRRPWGFIRRGAEMGYRVAGDESWRE